MKWSWLLLLPTAALALLPRIYLPEIAQLSAAAANSAGERVTALLPLPQVGEALAPMPEAAALMAIDGSVDGPTPPKSKLASEQAVNSERPAKVGRQNQKTKPAASNQQAKRVSWISISAQRTQQAIKAGIRPSGGSVGKTSWRSAGLALYGVSALGVGLRDGDVLTKINGSPARSQTAVISAVRSAWSDKAKGVSGEVWRGHHRFMVAVEFPERSSHAKRRPAVKIR